MESDEGRWRGVGEEGGELMLVQGRRMVWREEEECEVK